MDAQPLGSRPVWRTEALCRGKPPAWFIASGSGRVRTTNPALELCVHCSVTERCLDEALAKPQWSLGIWAGTMPRERADIAKSMRDVIACRTDIRSEAFFVQFEEDECITRDVDEAVQAPAHIAVVLATRCELSVVAAVALTARHDKRIAARIAAKCDQPVWLRNAASRIARRR